MRGKEIESIREREKLRVSEYQRERERVRAAGQVAEAGARLVEPT